MKLMDKFLERNKEINYHSWQDNFWYFLSIPFVAVLRYTPITPNMVSFAGILAIYISAFLFGFGHPWLAVLCLYLSEWTDRLDGALARAKNQKSVLVCEMLCKWYHQCSFAFLFAGLGFFSYWNNFYFIGKSPVEGWLLAGFFAAFLQQFTAYFWVLRDFLVLKYLKSGVHTKKIFINTDKEKIILKMFTLPNVWLFHVLLIATIFNMLDWVLLFYTVFLSLRTVLFVGHTWYNFSKREKLI